MDENTGSSLRLKRGKLLLRLHDVFFSVNVACAVAYALSLYVSRSMTPWTPQNDSGYYFLRAAVRVSDILHLGIRAPVTTNTVARVDSILFNRTAIALVFVVSICSAAALVFLLVRFCALSSRYPAAFCRLAGAVALFATPACCLVVLMLTRTWPTGMDPGTSPSGQALLVITAGELSCFLALLLLTFKLSRWRAIFVSASVLLSLLHFAFWSLILLPNVLIYLRGSLALYPIHSALWLLPSAGAAFLLYVWPGPGADLAPTAERHVGIWTLLPAVLGLAALVAIWHPTSSRTMVQPKDMKSVVIKLSRGPRPSYTITIQGDGKVEYVGERDVKVRGTQTATLNSEQLTQVLRRLDQSHFFALEDRAFSWCFDTPGVAVAVSFDGRTKTVVSDGGCTGAKSGMQDQFVQAAHDIDKIVGTDQWVRCDGYCRD
jgi:hypothetical protein